jgi:hypothetical protein
MKAHMSTMPTAARGWRRNDLRARKKHPTRSNRGAGAFVGEDNEGIGFALFQRWSRLGQRVRSGYIHSEMRRIESF